MYPAAITMRVLSPISGRGGFWLSLVTLSTLTALSASTLGCASDDGKTEVGEDDGNLACDVPKLFETRCAGDSCHGGGDSSAAGLDLISAGVEERVSGATGQSCGGIVADPANPENSLLYEKIADVPECGARMPLATEALSEDEITCVRDWISGLLPPTTGDCANCMCEPGTSEDCYAGPEPTANVGICQTGTHTCQTSGLGYGACEGESLPSIEECMTDLDENCDGVTPACAEIWSVGFGSPVSQVMRAAMPDAEGNIFGFGDFEGTVDFGGPENLEAVADKSDIVLVKLDHFGTPLWSKHWGDSSNQYATEMIVDAEGNPILIGRIYGAVDFGTELTAGGAGDLLVVKLDNDGNHVWSRVFGDKDPDRAERVTVDAEGDVIVTGTFTTEIDFGGGPLMSAGLRDAFVAELDGQTGAHIASVQIGGVGDDYGFGVDVTPDGGVVIAGRFGSLIELGGALTSAGETDIYFARLDSSLMPVWSQSFGAAGVDEPHDLAVQQNGDIVMVGGFSNTVDFGGGGLVSAGARDIFLATFDDAGEHVWSNSYGDATDQFGGSFELNSSMSLALDDANGTIYMAGYLLGAVDFDGQVFDASGDTNADAFYTVFDAGGTFVTGQHYGAGGTELMHDINVASDGLIVLAGRMLGSRIDFEDAGTVLGWGDADGFIAKIEP
jgi:hypothetical protein